MNIQNASCFFAGIPDMHSTVNRMVAGSSPAQGAILSSQIQSADGCSQAAVAARSVSRSVDRSRFRSGAVALVMLAIGGCSVGYEGGSRERSADSIGVWSDPETGCNYFMRSEFLVGGNISFGGMSPKLRADGTPDCPSAPAAGG